MKVKIFKIIKFFYMKNKSKFLYMKYKIFF